MQLTCAVIYALFVFYLTDFTNKRQTKWKLYVMGQSYDWSDGGTWMITFVWTVLNNAELLLQKCKNTSVKKMLFSLSLSKNVDFLRFYLLLKVRGQVMGNEPGYKVLKHETSSTPIPVKWIVSWTCYASLSFTADVSTVTWDKTAVTLTMLMADLWKKGKVSTGSEAQCRTRGGVYRDQ